MSGGNDTLTLEQVHDAVKSMGGDLSELTGYMTTLAKKVYKEADDVAENEPEPVVDEKTQDWEKSVRSKRTVRFLKSSKRGRQILRAMDDLIDEGYGGNGNGNGEEEYPDMMDEEKARMAKRGHRGRYARYQEGDEEYPPLDDMDGMNGLDDLGMNGEGDDMMPYDEDEEYQDEQMMMAMKLLRAVQGYKPRKARRTEKGFADAAKKKADEEDTPFGEKDDDVPANEPSPAGRQGGDRQEETFGPGGMAYSAMLKDLGISPAKGKALAQLINLGGEGQGQEVAKALIPAGAPGDARGGKAGIGGEIITREMQEETKKRSYRDINRLRMDVGDLPRTLF